MQDEIRLNTEVRIQNEEEEKIPNPPQNPYNPSEYEEEKFSHLENRQGINFIKWDFNNDEVKEFRYVPEPIELISGESQRNLPRYINKVENYKFKYTYVDIKFGKWEFSISVFDKPKDLKEKVAEIANKPKLKGLEYYMRLQDKESYIYGDNILVDFEPIYNALIRGKHVSIKCTKKSNVGKTFHAIRFWTYDKNDAFKKEQIHRKQLPKYGEGEYGKLETIDHHFRFRIVSFNSLYSIIRLLLK